MEEDDFDSVYERAQSFLKENEETKYLELINELANSGYVQAQIDLASIYTAGFYEHYPVNIDLALEWHLKAEGSNNADNYFCMALLFDPSFEHPTKTFSSCADKSKEYYTFAFEGFKFRAEAGDLYAIYKLGEFYSGNYMVVEKNEELSKYWFDKYFEIKGVKD